MQFGLSVGEIDGAVPDEVLSTVSQGRARDVLARIRTMHQMEMPPMVMAELTRRRLFNQSTMSNGQKRVKAYWLKRPLKPVLRLISSRVEAAPTKLTT